MKNPFFLGLLLLCLFSACKKDQTKIKLDAEYLSFGTAHGFCMGDCAHIYLLQDGKLYRDEMDRYDASQLQFSNSPASAADYQKAAVLLEEFPNYLLAQPDSTFGCPDCRDQGGIYLQLKKEGIVYNWQLDTDTNDLPQELREFAKKILNLVDELR